MTYFVVFGAAVRPDGSPSGTLERRVAGAIALWSAGSAGILLVSGGQGRFGPPEALVMKQTMIARGVPDCCILVDELSRDTVESVLNCRRLILARGDSAEVVVCSSPYHNPRCWLLFRLLGVPARIGTMPTDRPALGVGKWLFYIVREITAIPVDAAIVTIRRLCGKV